MSWDGHVDNIIFHGRGDVSKAAIIDLNGSVWTPPTRAQVINLSAAEALSIGQTMAGSSPKDVFAPGGITLEGVRYQFLNDVHNDGKVMFGKKKDMGAIILQKTKTAVVIAHVSEGRPTNFGLTAVGVMSTYLEGAGM